MSSKKAAKKSKNKKKGQGGEHSGASAKRAARMLDAVRVGDCGAMERLIDGGLDVDAMSEATSRNGTKMLSTALCVAVGFNQKAVVRLLLDRGANPNLANSTGVTPLMNAAHVGSLPILRMLVKANAEVDTVDRETGFTAYHSACVNNQPDCAEALVRAGCDTSVTTQDGVTGRDLAQLKGNTAVLERLAALEQHRPSPVEEEQSKVGAKDAARLLDSAKVGDCAMMERLIDGGVDVDAMSETTSVSGEKIQATALLSAVTGKQQAGVRLLLHRGANPNLADSDGTTPLMIAAGNDFLPMLRLLLEAKAEVNAVHPLAGHTAFHAASLGNYPDCAEALVRAGCDTSLRTVHGQAGRDIAQAQGHTAVLERLDALGQDISSSEKKADDGRGISSKKAAKMSKKKKGQGGEQSGAATKRAARLGDAAKSGDCGAMDRLLKAGLNVDAQFNMKDKSSGKAYQSTALHQTITNKQVAAARLLLDRGADPNLAISAGHTPLMAAAQVVAMATGPMSLVELLLEAKAEVDAVDPEFGFTAFHFTCYHNHPDCAEALVRAGCDTSLRSQGGETGRDIAKAKGHTAVLERLDALRQGSSSSAEKKNRSPKADGLKAATLLKAAEDGEATLAQVLRDAGSDVNAPVLGTAYEDGSIFSTTALYQAACAKRKLAVRRLLQHGADPNATEPDRALGSTALMGAAQEGPLSILRMLLEAGAEIDTADASGWTAFHWACAYNQPDCAEALVRAGCDTSLRNQKGYTGRDLARANRHPAVVRLLRSLETVEQRWLHAAQDGDTEELTRQLDGGHVEIDGLVETVNNDGDTVQATVLDIATGRRQDAAVRLLLNRGANPNLANSYGCTPLMNAALRGSLPILRLLMDAGAEVSAVYPVQGFTAFHAACINNHPDCAEALVRAGCNTSKLDGDGMTGRDIAQEEGNTA
eukprot:COSAG04_NODE_2698_length_3716_cov_4.770904_1_plen_931_part_10